MQPTPNTPHTTRRAVSTGFGLWVTFCLVAVVLRGVRWDENYEFAQVITRTISYTEGHPLFRYVRSMFSLQTYSLAALLCLTPSPALLCGLRNVLFLMATVLPAFLLGSMLSRRTLWGHVAAAIVLLGTHLAFYSTYPQFVWPHMYSNGHIGTGYALLVVYLLASGHWRTGYFLVGLMPCIHLGQWPPVLGFAGLLALWTWQRGHGRRLNRALTFAALGLAISAGFWGVLRLFAVPGPTGGPYYSATDPQAVWLGYMARHASHRSIPWCTGHITLAALPLLGLGAARMEARDGNPGGPWCWILVYGTCVACIVWATMAVHVALTSRIPFLLVSWMPYRLMNHLPPLLVVMTVAVLSGTRDRKTAAELLVAAVLLYGITKPGLQTLVGNGLYARYFETGIGVFFALYGAAIGVVMRQLKDDRPFLVPWIAAGLLGWVALGLVHQFGAACCACGLGAALALEQKTGTATSESPRQDSACFLRRLDFEKALGALAFVLVAVLAYREWATRDHLPVSPFERRVVEYLDAQGEQDAMLVAGYQQEGLQARTGHPVMADMATMTWIAYKPSLGPAMDKLYGDLYGIHFTQQPTTEVGPQAWFERWAARSFAQWQALSEEYAFCYLVAPKFITLDLPQVVEGKTESLYYIPPRNSDS